MLIQKNLHQIFVVLPGTTLKIFGGGWVLVEGNFSVLLWSKTGILSLNSELDQAEQ